MIKLLKRIMFFCVLCSIAAVTIGAYLTTKYVKMNKEVTLHFELPEKIERGVPFSINALVENKGTTPLKNAEISLKLPKEIVNADARNENETSKVVQSLGDIISGNVRLTTTTLIAVEETSENIAISAALKYLNENGTKYENEQEILLSISAKDLVKVTLKAPEEVKSGTRTSIMIQYENLSETDYREVSIEAAYPDAFRFINASLPPENNRNIWNVGEVRKNSKGTIEIRGIFEESTNSEFEISAKMNARYGGKDFPLGSGSAKTKLEKAPIGLEIITEGITENEAVYGERLNFVIRVKNDTSAPLTNIIAKATLNSSGFDLNTTQTDGKPNSASTTISWDNTNNQSLTLFDPATTREFRITVNTRKEPATAGENAKARLTFEITADSGTENNPQNKIQRTATKELTLTDILTIKAKTLFNDKESNPANKGSIPPKVGSATEFTIHWYLRNAKNPVNNIEVRAKLGKNVTWKKTSITSAGIGPRYDTATREVIWTIPELTPGNTATQSRSAFQVEVTPTLENVGQYLTLIERTTASGQETGTGRTVQAQASIQTTQLTDDPTVSKNNGKVIP